MDSSREQQLTTPRFTTHINLKPLRVTVLSHPLILIMSSSPSQQTSTSIKRRPSQATSSNPHSHSSSPHSHSHSHGHSQSHPDPTSLLNASNKRRKLSHTEALEHIRTFLKSQSSYDVFPVSFRLIVLDHHLVVKKALAAMLQHGEQIKRKVVWVYIRLLMLVWECRGRLSAAMGFREIPVRRYAI